MKNSILLYLLVCAVGIILIGWGYIFPIDTITYIAFMGLGVNLVSASITFFVVNMLSEERDIAEKASEMSNKLSTLDKKFRDDWELDKLIPAWQAWITDWEKRRYSEAINQLTTEVAKVHNAMEGKSSDNFFQEKYFTNVYLTPYFQQSKRVDVLVGLELSDIFIEQANVMKRKLNEDDNKKCQIIFLNPSDSLIKMVAKNGGVAPATVKETIYNSYNKILIYWFDNDASRMTESVKFIDYLPPFSLIRFKGAYYNDSMVISLNTSYHLYQKPPLFHLSQAQDSLWYEYFNKKFDYIYSQAKSRNQEDLIYPEYKPETLL